MNTHFTVCPNCGDRNPNVGDTNLNSDGSSVEVYVACRECGTEWVVYFDFAGSEILDSDTEPDIDERYEVESALASAGYGTDEDYGYFGGDE